MTSRRHFNSFSSVSENKNNHVNCQASINLNSAVHHYIIRNSKHSKQVLNEFNALPKTVAIPIM